MINPSRQVRSPATRAVLPTDLCIILTPSVRDFTASAATSRVPVLLMGLDSSREIWLTPLDGWSRVRRLAQRRFTAIASEDRS
jgi:hypothetical protein